MRKKFIYKFLYVISAVLVVAFAVCFGIDAYMYDFYQSSAPLYAYALIRALEFLLPSLCLFVVALLIKRNMKNKQ